MASVEGVARAHETIRAVLQPTPILTSSAIDELVGCKILFKSEHLQKTGSFKARGAVHNMKLVTERGDKGVITHSSGNHGQAVAWAARAAGVECTVVVPEGAPAAKLEAIAGYGARIVRCENTPASRSSTCSSLAASEGLAEIHPCYTIDTIEGQGSLGLELKEQLPSVPPLFIAMGGGGLAAGLALALPDTPLYLVEPEGKNLTQQLDGSEAVEQLSLPTIADGIRTRLIGEENKKVLSAHKHTHVVTVTETEIRAALALIWTRLKQHVEPTAAVPLAALIKMSSQSALPFKEAMVIFLATAGGTFSNSLDRFIECVKESNEKEFDPEHGYDTGGLAQSTSAQCTRSNGARIVRCENTPASRSSTCSSLAASEGLAEIHPCYTIDTIEGQGSLGLELKEQLPSVPPLFIAMGGGGLAAGLALALPDTPLYLVEPEGKNLTQQLDGSEAVEQLSLPTIADGIRTRLIGEENKKVLSAHKRTHVVTVTETEIRAALALIWTRLKQHVEPTAAVPLAALIKMSSQSALPFKEAMVILCGGNVDVSFTP